MANNTIMQNGKVDELIVDAHFVMRSYEGKDGKTVEYVAFELIDPFKDEDFRDVALKAKWDKYDDNNRLVRPDRVFGYMTYYAKKALRTSPEVPVKVKISSVTYKSKKTNEQVTYAAMFAMPTFAELEDERPVEVVVKGATQNNIFGLLASKALGIKLLPKNELDPDDIGLM